MAMEQLTTGDTNWAWLGDLPNINDVQTYANHLVTNDFMKAADAVKVFNGGGLPRGTFENNSVTISSSNSPFNFYRVKDVDANVTVFITSRNYSYNSPLDASTKPFGDAGFMVMRKGGDGAIFRKTQATDTNLVGSLPEGNSSSFQ